MAQDFQGALGITQLQDSVDDLTETVNDMTETVEYIQVAVGEIERNVGRVRKQQRIDAQRYVLRSLSSTQTYNAVV